MNRFATRSASVFLLLLLGAFASATASAQGLVFPVEPERTITREDGSTVEIYNATVQSVRGSRLTVRFPHGDRFTYDVPSDFRFSVDGRQLPVQRLQRGDRLTAYVTKHPEQGHVLHHVEESADTAPKFVSEVRHTETPDEAPAELPATASNLPLFGLIGALSLALGLAGFAVRRRLS